MKITTAPTGPSLPTPPLNATSLPVLSTTANSNATHFSSPQNAPLTQTTCPDLPDDPKSWSSAHVATYLAYSLQLYPPAVIRELTRHVQGNSKLDGRRFLRLKEEQLRNMGFSEGWVSLMMLGVKALRRETLTQKILLKCDGGLNPQGSEDLEDHLQINPSESTPPALSSSASPNRDAPENQELIMQPKPWLIWLVSLQRFMPFPNNIQGGTEKWYYGNGFFHGAIVSGVAVWVCTRLAAKW